MEPLFKFCVEDINILLPHMKIRLMSGTENALIWTEKILTFLKEVNESEKGVIVGNLVKFDIISTICDIMQTSDKNFVRIVLECFELISTHKEFYKNDGAMDAINSMLRLSYCIKKSLKDSALFENLVQCICNILVRSLKLVEDFKTVCVPQQIVLFFKDMDIKDSQKDKLKLTAVTMLNVILQQAFDENVDVEIIIDVCHDALQSMTEIAKYCDEDNTILLAVTLLCGTCAGGSRFCNIDLEQEDQIDANMKICQKKTDLTICIYNTTISIIIPYVKDADLSRVDSIEFHRNLVCCLNNLYHLRDCNHDNLSNHLATNGYLKYFLHLTVQLPENLRRSICILLSRILSILGKMAFCKDTNKFGNILRHGLLDLPKDSTERWNDSVAHVRKDGVALMILLYYHFHGTEENDVISLQSLVAAVMRLPQIMPITVFILKPLWFLFVVMSISHPRPNLIPDYGNAVIRLTNILQCLEINKFYTHHVDLLCYYLECPDVSQSLMNQVLDLWLIESDGDMKPLLPFNCDKVIRRLLVVAETGYPKRIISLAVKGLRQLIQISKNDKHIDQIAEVVWQMLPNILSSYQSDTVEHIEVALELANITQPTTIPIRLITRSADIIANIILKKNTSKFMTLAVTQAYVLLVAAVSRKSFKVLQIYIEKPRLLKELYVYGFSKERSQLSSISIKLLAFIIHCQKGSSMKCNRPLVVHMQSLVELLTDARKSPYCAMNEMQFICELLTQNVDGSSIDLPNIPSDVENVVNLYAILHIIHIEKAPIQKDMVYQCLVAVLQFCNMKATALLPHLCTVMSNYDLVFHVVNMRYVSCHFVEFVTTWLNYRKTNCRDVLWNSRSLFKSPFDEVLDNLKEYSVIINNKLKDSYLNLQRALSQFE